MVKDPCFFLVSSDIKAGSRYLLCPFDGMASSLYHKFVIFDYSPNTIRESDKVFVSLLCKGRVAINQILNH